MAGLYIHIPFCRSKCAYCDFFSLPLDKYHTANVTEEYCKALLKEFELREREVDEPFSTIYIGGGTPTAIPDTTLLGFISALIHKVGSHNNACGKASIDEFTIEANPEDITSDKIEALKSAGINRISIGIQSFDAQQLDTINRLHDAKASISALQTLYESGINYSADLIYGLPGQNVESWKQQLEKLLEYRPPHFSAYLLSYEPGTKLYVRRELGKVSETDEETVNRMYEVLINAAGKRGYDHYEISNFALPGMDARHNSSYWNLTPYVGLGCSAHSFDGNTRRVNPANLKSYISALSVDNARVPAFIEDETQVNKINDYIITSLRTSAGLSRPLVESRWGATSLRIIEKNMTQFKKNGQIITTPFGNLTIAENHWLTADAILREIILDPDDII